MEGRWRCADAERRPGLFVPTRSVGTRREEEAQVSAYHGVAPGSGAPSRLGSEARQRLRIEYRVRIAARTPVRSPKNVGRMWCPPT